MAPELQNDSKGLTRLGSDRDLLVAGLDAFSTKYLCIAPRGAPGLPCTYGVMLARQRPLPLPVAEAEQEIAVLKQSIAFLEEYEETFLGEERQHCFDLKTSYKLRLVLLLLPGNTVKPAGPLWLKAVGCKVPERFVESTGYLALKDASCVMPEAEDESLIIPVTVAESWEDGKEREQEEIFPSAEETEYEPGDTDADPFPARLTSATLLTAETDFDLTRDPPALLRAMAELTGLFTEFNRTGMAPSAALYSELMLRVTDCLSQVKQNRPELLSLLAQLSLFLHSHGYRGTVKHVQKYLGEMLFDTDSQLLSFRPSWLIAWLIMDHPVDLTLLEKLIDLPELYQSFLTPKVMRFLNICFLWHSNRQVLGLLSRLAKVITILQLVEKGTSRNVREVIDGINSLDTLPDGDGGTPVPLLTLCLDYHRVLLCQAAFARCEGSCEQMQALLTLYDEGKSNLFAATYWQQDPPNKALVWHSQRVMLQWAKRCAQPFNTGATVTFGEREALLHRALLRDTDQLSTIITIGKRTRDQITPALGDIYLAIALTSMVRTCARAEGLLPSCSLNSTDFTRVNTMLWKTFFPEQFFPLLLRYSRALDVYVQGFCLSDLGKPVPRVHGQQSAEQSDDKAENLRSQYLQSLEQLISCQGAVLCRAGCAEALESLRVGLLRLYILDSTNKKETLVFPVMPEAFEVNVSLVKAIGSDYRQLVATHKRWTQITRSPITIWNVLVHFNDQLMKSIYAGWEKDKGRWSKQFHPGSPRQQFKQQTMVPTFQAMAGLINILLNIETPWAFFPVLTFLMDNHEAVGLFSLLEWLCTTARSLNIEHPTSPVDYHLLDRVTAMVSELDPGKAKKPKKPKQAKKPKKTSKDLKKVASKKEQLPTPEDLRGALSMPAGESPWAAQSRVQHQWHVNWDQVQTLDHVVEESRVETEADATRFRLRRKISYFQLLIACRRLETLPSYIKTPAVKPSHAEQCTLDLLMARSAEEFRKLVPSNQVPLNTMAQLATTSPYYINPELKIIEPCYHSNLITIMAMAKRIFLRDFSESSTIAHRCQEYGHQDLLLSLVYLINQDFDKLRGVLPDCSTDPFFDLLKAQLCLQEHQWENNAAIALHQLLEAWGHFESAGASDYPPIRANWAAFIIRFPEIIAQPGRCLDPSEVLQQARDVLDFVSYEKDWELHVLKLWLDYQEHGTVPTAEDLQNIHEIKGMPLSHGRSYYRLWSLHQQDQKFLFEDLAKQLVPKVLRHTDAISVLYLLLDRDLPAFKQQAVDWFIDNQDGEGDTLLSNLMLFWPNKRGCTVDILHRLTPKLAKRLTISEPELGAVRDKYPDLNFWRGLYRTPDCGHFLLDQLTVSDSFQGEASASDQTKLRMLVELLAKLPKGQWAQDVGCLNRLLEIFHGQRTTERAVFAELLVKIAFGALASKASDEPRQRAIVSALMVVFQDKRYWKLAHELLPKTAHCAQLLLVILVETLQSSTINMRAAQALLAIVKEVLPKIVVTSRQRERHLELIKSALQLSVSKQLAELVSTIQELGQTLFSESIMALETMERQGRIDHLRLLKKGGKHLMDLIDANSSVDLVEDILDLEGAQTDYQKIVPILVQPRKGQIPLRFIDQHFALLLHQCCDMANHDHRYLRSVILSRVTSEQLAESVNPDLVRNLFLERASQQSDIASKTLRAHLMQQQGQVRLQDERYLTLETIAVYMALYGSQQEIAEWLPRYLPAMVAVMESQSTKKKQAGAIQFDNALAKIRESLVARFPQIFVYPLLTHPTVAMPQTDKSFKVALILLACRYLAVADSQADQTTIKEELINLGIAMPASCLPEWLKMVNVYPWSSDEWVEWLSALLPHCTRAIESHPPGTPQALVRPLELVRRLPQYLAQIELTELLSRHAPLAEQAKQLIGRCEQGRAVESGVAIEELIQEADTLLAVIRQDQDQPVDDWCALQIRTRLQWHSGSGQAEAATVARLQAKEQQLLVQMRATKLHQLLAPQTGSSKRLVRSINKWLDLLDRAGMAEQVLALLSEQDRALLRQYAPEMGSQVIAGAVSPESPTQEKASLSPVASKSPPPLPKERPQQLGEGEITTESCNRTFWLNFIHQGDASMDIGQEQFFSEILTIAPHLCLEREELHQLHQWFKDRIDRHFQDKDVFTPLSTFKGAAAYDARCRLVDLVMSSPDLEPSFTGPLMAYKAAVLDDKRVFCPNLSGEIRRADDRVHSQCIIESSQLGCTLYLKFVGIVWPKGEQLTQALVSACRPFTVQSGQDSIRLAGRPEQVEKLDQYIVLLANGMDSIGKSLLSKTVKTALLAQCQSTLSLFQQLRQAHNKLAALSQLSLMVSGGGVPVLNIYQQLEAMQVFILEWQNNREWWSHIQRLARSTSIAVRAALSATLQRVTRVMDELRPQVQARRLADQISTTEQLQWDHLLPLLELSPDQLSLLLSALGRGHLDQLNGLLQTKLPLAGKKTQAKYRPVADRILAEIVHRDTLQRKLAGWQTEVIKLLLHFYTTRVGEVSKILKDLQAFLKECAPYKGDLGEEYFQLQYKLLLAEFKLTVVDFESLAKPPGYPVRAKYATLQLRRTLRLLSELLDDFLSHPPSEAMFRWDFYQLANRLLSDPHMPLTPTERDLLGRFMQLVMSPPPP